MLQSEYERRRQAVSRVRAGDTVVSAARSVGRTEQWLHKWLRRYEAEGEPGLRDRSSAPRHTPSATLPSVVDTVLLVRAQLEASEHQGIGAEAIRYELELQGTAAVPSVSTIERILRRAGRTAKPKRARTSERHRPRPTVLGPGVVQQSDWVGPRYLGRRLAFYSLHTLDVGGGGAAAAQFPDRRMEHAAAFMAEVAWPVLSIPGVAQVDNAFALARPRFANPFNLFVRTCLLFGVEVVVTPPNELGWMNHVESFNGLWQARTIRRHRYASVGEVAASSDRFIDYYMNRRPHPALSVAGQGSRFPARVIQASARTCGSHPRGSPWRPTGTRTTASTCPSPGDGSLPAPGPHRGVDRRRRGEGPGGGPLRRAVRGGHGAHLSPAGAGPPGRGGGGRVSVPASRPCGPSVVRPRPSGLLR